MGSAPNKRVWRKEDGYTLVELLVASVFLFLVTALSFDIFRDQYRFFIYHEDFADNTAQLVSGLNTMVLDIRQTAADPQDAGLFVPNSTTIPILLSAGGADPCQVLNLLSDRNGNGSLEALPNENITYRVANGRLLRNGVTLMDHITSFQIRFFNRDGTEEICSGGPEYDTLDVRLVKVTIGQESGIHNPRTNQPTVRWVSALARIESR